MTSKIIETTKKYKITLILEVVVSGVASSFLTLVVLKKKRFFLASKSGLGELPKRRIGRRQTAI